MATRWQERRADTGTASPGRFCHLLRERETEYRFVMASPAPLAPVDKVAQVDYWLNKLFFDLQRNPDQAAQWRTDRASVLGNYPLAPDIRAAILADDIAVLAAHANAYLLRFYFSLCGMSDAELIQRLRALAPSTVMANG
jgi:hypothetical protein